VFTSAQLPGLIYDVLMVSPASLAAHRADYARLIGVWDRVVSYINDPSTQQDAVQIMAARVGLSAAQYQPLLAGTHLLGIAEAKKVFARGEGLESLYGSSKNADAFNVRYHVYRQPQNIDGCIEPALTLAQP
jgi:NitT/TauT family transport system substrate-binding protein